jgi:osmoprotectant transport system substrate-binding protein
MRLSKAAFISVVLIALVLGACTPSPGGGGGGTTTTGKGPITIGSKIDTEGQLLGHMIKLMLEQDGFKVVDKISLGPTDVNRKALLAGEIDMYPEYTGTALSTFFPNEKLDPAIARDATKSYDTVKGLDLPQNDVAWLGRAPANNTWAIAIPKTLSDSESIKTLEDFAAYVNKGGKVKIAGSAEFFDRPDAMKSFEKVYGFTLKKDQMLALSGGDTAQTEQAAAKGTSGANAAMAYGTDGSLAALGLVVLSDPKGAQPIYQPAPTVRGAVAEKYPEMARILDPVFATLDEATLQGLNAQIALQGKNAADVAKSYLTQKGFLK